MVKVKVIFGKVAFGEVADNKLGIEGVETRIYREGDVFDCPENRLKDITGSNQIKILEPTPSLEKRKR